MLFTAGCSEQGPEERSKREELGKEIATKMRAPIEDARAITEKVVLREISWSQMDFYTTADARGGQRESEEGCFKCSSNGALVFKGRPDVRAVFLQHLQCERVCC